jgi:hypothetical protein
VRGIASRGSGILPGNEVVRLWGPGAPVRLAQLSPLARTTNRMMAGVYRELRKAAVPAREGS